MKKHTRIAFAVVMVAGLGACGSAVDTAASTRNAPATVAPTAVPTTHATTTTVPATTAHAGTTTIPATTAHAVPAAEPTTTGAPTATDAPPTPAAPAPTITEPPATAAAPTPPADAPAPGSVVVTNVVDGDTVDVSTGERVRVIGIDSPEIGQCGSAEATARMTDLVGGQPVTLVGGAANEVDRYGRILRYVDGPSGDAGAILLGEGLAHARYDSRDGYGSHPREEQYRALDFANPNTCDPAITAPPATAAPKPATTAAPTSATAPGRTIAPKPTPATTTPRRSGAVYKNCDDVRAHGAAPIHAGDAGWQPKFDRDHDGVGCE